MMISTTILCRECDHEVRHNGATDVCTNPQCGTRTAHISADQIGDLSWAFYLLYRDPISGDQRIQLMEAETFIQADMEAQQLGYTVDYGVE